MTKSSPQARVQVRVPQDMKIELEQLASQQNMSLQDFVRHNWQDLLLQGKLEVDQGDSKVSVPNPYWPNPFPQMPNYRGVSPGMPIMGMQTPGMATYPNPYINPHQQPDALDQFVNEVRKMAVARMFMEMMQGLKDPEHMLRLANRNNGGGGSGGFSSMSLEDILKYKALTDKNDEKMNSLFTQMLNARASGDKAGEDKAFQMMIALMANQNASTQQMMQMNMQQNQTAMANTRDVFQAALSGQNKYSEEQRRADQQSNDRYTQLMQMMMQNSQSLTTQMFQQQMANQAQMAQVEMERIRESSKSPVDQFANLVELRKTNPVYKVAFDAMMGIKDESMIGKIIPQLKEMGLDKAVEGIGTFLKNMVLKPQIPQPGTPQPTAFPPPSPLNIPPTPLTGQPQFEATPQPFGQPPQGQPPEALKNLSLPGTPKPQETPPEKPTEFTATPPPPEIPKKETVAKELPESAMGYTNLNRPGHPVSKPEKK